MDDGRAHAVKEAQGAEHRRRIAEGLLAGQAWTAGLGFGQRFNGAARYIAADIEQSVPAALQTQRFGKARGLGMAALLDQSQQPVFVFDLPGGLLIVRDFYDHLSTALLFLT